MIDRSGLRLGERGASDPNNALVERSTLGRGEVLYSLVLLRYVGLIAKVCAMPERKTESRWV